MLLLYEMSKLDMIAVKAEACRKDESGVSLFFSTWSSPDNAFAAMLAKSPGDWTRADAIMTSALHGVWTVVWIVGASAVCAAAGLDVRTAMTNTPLLHSIARIVLLPRYVSL